jgi:Tfp pilus assembly protein PilF
MPDDLWDLAFASKFAAQALDPAGPRFCWILGAGASAESKIPAASTLAKRWLKELYADEGRPGEDEATFAKRVPELAAGFDITIGEDVWNPEKPEQWYSELYDLRFYSDARAGFVQLEEAMKDRDPSLGYTVLAQILARTPHRVVLTVNFDNLVADSLAIHTDVLPLVCGHESLANYARLDHARPLVLKVHRDLLLEPKNRKEELARLEEGWKNALNLVAQACTPIVIGYAGNDGSLMKFLEEAPFQRGLYWCYRKAGEPPSDRIRAMVQKHHGRFIAIPGFDEFLYLLGSELDKTLAPNEPKYTDALSGMQRRHDRRRTLYADRTAELSTRLTETAPTADAEASRSEVRKSVEASIRSIEKQLPWWEWQRRAESEEDPEIRDRIYREGTQECSKSPELLSDYADFLTNVVGDQDRAEEFYLRAAAVEPGYKLNLTSYAGFLTEVRNDYERAEELYRRAICSEPNDAYVLTKYAQFLANARQNPDRADEFYRRAIDAEPNYAYALGNYAEFLANARQNPDRADEFYRRAIDSEPNYAYILNRYARFLADVRQDPDRADEFYRRAIDAEPNYAYALGNYAEFLAHVRKEPNRADEFYRRAIDADPDDGYIRDRYDLFSKAHESQVNPHAATSSG